LRIDGREGETGRRQAAIAQAMAGLAAAVAAEGAVEQRFALGMIGGKFGADGDQRGLHGLRDCGDGVQMT
jgi:hypothetical protein